MVIIVGFSFLPLVVGELLEVEVALLTTGWTMVSCIGCEPMPLRGVQGAVNVVTCGPPTLWLFCFNGCGLDIIVFFDLKIIRQV